MAFTHIDLIGLNKYEMHDAPIVRTNAELIGLKDEMPGKSFSIAGMRHSQGGHTALEGECMVFTEAMEQNIKNIKEIKEIVGADGVVEIQEVEETDPNPPNLKFIKVNAGATWSEIHFHLGPMGYAPLVHQSSPHFSIGGSLSVDCHGREVTEGALSNTVESITVLTNRKGEGLKPTKASRTLNRDLFFGALGGYGACGVILDATIQITKNEYMYKFGTRLTSIELLNQYLLIASEGKRIIFDFFGKPKESTEPIYMFYAWMDVSQIDEKYLTQAMAYEYIPQTSIDLRMRISDFKNEGWASTEAMRAAWSAGRRDASLREKLFEIIAEKTIENQNGNNSRINFLREEISFTSTKGDATDVDLLQEFFIPLHNIVVFLNQLKILLPIGNATIEVLSCTLRIIQPPHEGTGKPFLSYAHRDAPFATPMVSVALEVKVKKERIDTDLIYPGFKVNATAIDNIKSIIDKALDLGGSYYLPYYQTASTVHFEKAYPNPGRSAWKKAADDWNPEVDGRRIFNNEFLKAHLK